MVCDRCGRRHGVVWFAPSDVWNAVMRDGDRANPDEYGFCCPICFITLAEERGIFTTAWLVTPFSDGPVRRAEDIKLVPPVEPTTYSFTTTNGRDVNAKGRESIAHKTYVCDLCTFSIYKGQRHVHVNGFYQYRLHVSCAAGAANSHSTQEDERG